MYYNPCSIDTPIIRNNSCNNLTHQDIKKPLRQNVDTLNRKSVKDIAYYNIITSMYFYSFVNVLLKRYKKNNIDELTIIK